MSAIYVWDASTGAYVLTDTADSTFYVNNVDGSFVVTTDQADYAPLSTATFTLNGVTSGDVITFDVTDLNGNPVSGTNQPWTVVASADGTVQTNWNVGADAIGQTFLLTAVDQTTGQVTTTQFTDAGVDLTTSSGTVNTAVFLNTNSAVDAGTGNFRAFLGIQQNGTESGYNTDNASTPLNDKTTASVHTGSLLLKDVPLVYADGHAVDQSESGPIYREFILDINQSGALGSAQSDITLTSLQIYLANGGTGNNALLASGAFDSTGTAFGSSVPLVYDLGNNPVLLSDHSSGSGKFDYRVLIPDADFTSVGGTDSSTDSHYVYLYSQFTGANGGFEEWGTSSTFQNISISGTKYTDHDGLDNQAAIGLDDTVLGGVTINLYDTTDLTKVIATTTTASDGTYSFTGLGPLNDGGSYFVQEARPSGDTETYGATGYTVAATSGNAATGEDFANFQNISISGVKYTDVNGDDATAAVGTGDDTPLKGVTINLFKNGGTTPFETTVTGDDGSYAFTNLGPGTYTVQEEKPSGDTETYGASGYTVAATSGQNVGNEDFANFQNISISGTKYTDVNGDDGTAAVGTGDDTPLKGVTIDLFKNGGTTPFETTVTGDDGSYAFTSLGPGTYTVQEEKPSGDTETYGASGYTVAATSGQNVGNEDFANFQNISISGVKYTDVNGDDATAAVGTVDDTPLKGVTIDLFKNGGTTPFETTVTGDDGSYAFTNLGPGTYTVQEEKPSGDTETYGASGYTVAATSGHNVGNEDFANFQNISISGVKYTDVNGDDGTAAVGTGDDTPLKGVTIDLFKNGGTTPFETTVTGDDGSYAFTNLGPGTYTVQEEKPSGDTETYGASGYTVTATSGQNVGNEDFANFQNISISGVKYTDVNGDDGTAAVGTGDDTPLKGVTIDLFKNGGTTPFETTVTGDDGSYAFTNLGPGTYTVQEEKPSGDTETYGASGYTVTATSGQNVGNEDFANFQNISISGVKYTDVNGDDGTAAVGTGDDTPLKGVTIDLFKNGGPTPFETTVTGDDGSYSFTNLGPGTYTVQEEKPSGDTETYGASGYTLTAASGQNVGNEDFANFVDVSISGTKYTDHNGLDNQAAIGTDDTVLGGVTINLYDTTDLTKVIATTTTASNGTYSFTGLGPLTDGGSYFVQEARPSGDTETYGASGYTVAATSGNAATGENFANFVNISISGTKYNDVNGDDGTAAVGTGDDTPLKGVTIDLFKNGGTTPFETTVTDSSGHFEFDNLGPGTYTVQEVTPSGWVETFGTAGYTVAAMSGQNVSGDNFANYQFIEGSQGLTQGFWANHKEAWDGTADTTWGQLVDKAGGLWGDFYTASSVSVTQKGNKYIGNDDILSSLPGHGGGGTTGGVLLGDANGDGHADNGEITLPLANTKALSYETATAGGNAYNIMMAQLVAAQLNIYNGDADPGAGLHGASAGHDLVGEAVSWLNAAGPSALTSSTLWTSKSFDTGISDPSNSGHDIMVSGQDIKNVLQAFNQDHIVTTQDGSHIAWSNDGGVTLLGVQANTPADVWLLAHQYGVI